MSHTGSTFEFVKRKPRRAGPSFRVALVRMLRSGLTKDTAFFALPDNDAGLPKDAGNPFGQGAMAGVPDLIFIHRGRAFGLELKNRFSSLSDEQRTAQVVLREAGMRVEVARDLGEALAHLRDMGIPLHVKRTEMFRRGRAA
jgi:hypothetical protein